MDPRIEWAKKRQREIDEEYREKHPEREEQEDDPTKWEREVDDWLSRFD